MGKRVSPAVIGAFVVASFAILVVALIVVGSGRMFTRPVRFICMFQGSLNGLKIGAPVKVRGVQIGTVESIELRILPSQGRMRPGIKGLRLPVIVDIDRSQLLAREQREKRSKPPASRSGPGGECEPSSPPKVS
jgi:hypothetical protein